jgi:hypothetical protein
MALAACEMRNKRRHYVYSIQCVHRNICLVGIDTSRGRNGINHLHSIHIIGSRKGAELGAVIVGYCSHSTTNDPTICQVRRIAGNEESES